jgi:DNA polymerase-2
VTCFGYLGYKNARFGRIEAHEAVTAYGREALLRAKEAAEDMGFTVLHLYVDGLWVKKPGAKTVNDFQPLLEEILSRTHLPIALEGVYRWVAFLPSRVNKRVPVANRSFGVFQDGSLKVRGIEARRGDTPAFIVDTQMQMLELLAQDQATGAVRVSLARPLALLRRRLAELRSGKVPAEALLVAQKLSRELEEYRARSPVARAVAQLQSAGKSLRPGQSVRFVYTRGKPGVRAWDLPEPPDPATIDIQRYTTLLLRAAHTVLEPFGLQEEALPDLAQPLPVRQLVFHTNS